MLEANNAKTLFLFDYYQSRVINYLSIVGVIVCQVEKTKSFWFVPNVLIEIIRPQLIRRIIVSVLKFQSIVSIVKNILCIKRLNRRQYVKLVFI